MSAYCSGIGSGAIPALDKGGCVPTDGMYFLEESAVDVFRYLKLFGTFAGVLFVIYLITLVTPKLAEFVDRLREKAKDGSSGDAEKASDDDTGKDEK